MDTVTITGNITLTRAQVEEAQQKLAQPGLPPDRACFSTNHIGNYLTIPRALVAQVLREPGTYLQVELSSLLERAQGAVFMYTPRPYEVEMTPEEVRAYFAGTR